MTTKRVVMIAILAALYAVFTILIAPLSYGPIQFRLSEILKVFVLFDPWLSLGIGIGTFIANMASPYVGPWELIFMQQRVKISKRHKHTLLKRSNNNRPTHTF